MTVTLSVGALLAAARFRRTGSQRHLLWLAGLFAHGVVHQRAVFFLAPSLLALTWGHWRVLWRHAGQIALLALGALATYLYLPLRAWMGADWTFNSPGTWRGFWNLVLDTKSERIVPCPPPWPRRWRACGTSLPCSTRTCPLLLALGLVARPALLAAPSRRGAGSA